MDIYGAIVSSFCVGFTSVYVSPGFLQFQERWKAIPVLTILNILCLLGTVFIYSTISDFSLYKDVDDLYQYLLTCLHPISNDILCLFSVYVPLLRGAFTSLMRLYTYR